MKKANDGQAEGFSMMEYEPKNQKRNGNRRNRGQGEACHLDQRVRISIWFMTKFLQDHTLKIKELGMLLNIFFYTA